VCAVEELSHERRELGLAHGGEVRRVQHGVARRGATVVVVRPRAANRDETEAAPFDADLVARERLEEIAASRGDRVPFAGVPCPPDRAQGELSNLVGLFQRERNVNAK